MEQNKESIIQNSDPYDYQKNEFGKVGFSFDDIKARKDDYATVFSEGSPALKNLLLHLWENDIETKACCTGHAGVQSFTKNTLFGQKAVDLEEWLAHKGSPRYHRWTKDTPAYFVYKTKPGEDAKEIGHQIQEELAKNCPHLPFFVSLNSENIEIRLKHYVLPNKIEQFFTAITAATNQVLGLQLVTPSKELPSAAERKPSLSTIVAGAEAKRAALLTTPSKAPVIGPVHQGR